MRGRMEIGRAAGLVEDVIRTYPEGASRDVRRFVLSSN